MFMEAHWQDVTELSAILAYLLFNSSKDIETVKLLTRAVSYKLTKNLQMLKILESKKHSVREESRMSRDLKKAMTLYAKRILYRRPDVIYTSKVMNPRSLNIYVFATYSKEKFGRFRELHSTILKLEEKLGFAKKPHLRLRIHFIEFGSTPSTSGRREAYKFSTRSPNMSVFS